MRNETVTTVVPAPRDAVFEYMSDIEKLPEWATEFARELKHLSLQREFTSIEAVFAT